MTSDESRNARDVTGQFRMAEPSPPMLLLFMCSHKGERLGAWMRGRIPWRCPACNTKGKGC